MNSEAVGNELAAIERLQGLFADWTVILTCGPRLGYQLKPLKACAALVTGHAVLLHIEPLAECDCYDWANFMVDTGHLPSWPLIEIRKPWCSSSQILSTAPAVPLVRMTVLPTSSVDACSNSARIAVARAFAAGMRPPSRKCDTKAVLELR